MHEISIIQNLLEGVLGQIEANNYQREAIEGLAVTIGALELHSEQAFRQAFAVESKGTCLEAASLELTVQPAVVECSGCGFYGALSTDKADPHTPDLIVECPRCAAPAAVTSGRGIQKIELILKS